MLIKDGRVREGLALLDEAMVAVTAEELSPIVTGIVYCGVILACQEVYEVRRAREWTRALADWWALQPEMVAFTGRCLVHRAEVLQLDGAWRDALDEARRAGSGSSRRRIRPPASLATARGAPPAAGRVRRRRAGVQGGERASGGSRSRDSLSCASRRGARTPPRPRSAVRRRRPRWPLERARLLPAFVEIMLAAGDVESARRACRELEELAARTRARCWTRSSRTRGARCTSRTATRRRRSSRCGERLRRGARSRRRTRSRGRACSSATRAASLGDEEAADLEHEAARSIFERLGAKPDLARLDAPSTSACTASRARELEVLRLVAPGKSNREIAASLVISEHTVARHVQNIFAKLGLSSRAAATAFAFEHDLV